MRTSFQSSTQSIVPFRIAFGNGPAKPGALLQISCPWLGGALVEEIFSPATPLRTEQEVKLFRTGGLVLGYASEPFVHNRVAASTEALYRRIFAAMDGLHLYRIWNYVPEINSTGAGVEHYRTFCQGRSFAFEELLGGTFESRLPAASAVGCDGSRLEVVVVGGSGLPTHVENPEQVPAYRYPKEHGPRAPSFARATVVEANDQTYTFVSGTSAIKGHQTVAPGALREQLDCTVDNLRLISRATGLGDHLGADRNAIRHFKVYLRHAADFADARRQLEQTLFRPSDTVIYLRADICRAALNVEIEATILQ